MKIGGGAFGTEVVLMGILFIKLLASRGSTSVLIVANRSYIFHTSPGCAQAILNLNSLGNLGKIKGISRVP